MTSSPSITSDQRRPLLDPNYFEPQEYLGDATEHFEGADTVDELKTGPVNVSKVFSEVVVLARSTIPLIFAYLLQYSLTLVTMAVAGHLSPLDLAATSVAIMTSNITGIGIYEGLAAGLDTLCAQAYGAGRPDMVGVHVQRMTHLMFVCTVPIGIAWIFSSHWLGFLVSDAELAERAGSVMAILFIGNPGYLLFESGRRFVQAQGLFDAPLYVMVLSLPTSIFFSWIFVSRFDWGLTGAVLALSVTRTFFPIFLLAYVLVVNPSSLSCWGGWESFQPKEWRRMIRLGIPGVCIVESELLMMEFLTLAATYLSVSEAAAQSIMTAVAVVLAHIPLATGIAVATRLGTLVGSESLYAAKLTMNVSIGISVALGTLDAGLLLLLQEPILKLFTEDRSVAELTCTALPILALWQIPEHATGVINGMLRGIGKQGRGAWIAFILFVVVEVPASLGLAFGSTHLRLSGLWLGSILAYVVISIISGIYGLSADLRKVVQKIRGSE